MITFEPLLTPNRPASYEVKVQGNLDPTWMQYFQGITAGFDGEVTTLTGIVADQSTLRGLLCYLWDFNLIVLSVVLVRIQENQLRIGCSKERE